MENLDLFLKESNAIEDVWDEGSLLQAKRAWNFLIRSKKLSEKNILWMHRILMKDHLPKKNRGAYRRQAVYVGGKEKLFYQEIPRAITEWIEKANKSISESEILADHIAFEEIHPFIDGNGRSGRIFLNYMRVKRGLPVFVFYEKTKQTAYYPLFRKREILVSHMPFI